MKNKRFTLLLLLLMAMLVIVACSEDDSSSDVAGDNNSSNSSTDNSGSDSNAGGATKGGVLEFAFNAQPPTLDPMATTATSTRDMARTIFEALVTFDENYQVQPLLAESYEVDTDAGQVIFKIRKDVKFHNGDTMTVEDVVKSMERWVTKSSQAKSFLPNATFTAPDDSTVVAQLEKSGFVDMYIFADQTQLAAIMPAEIVAQEEITEYVGTGPYKFVEWKQDQYVLVERFDEYVSPQGPASGLAGERIAYADQIKFNIVTDSITRVTGLQTGEYHVSGYIPYDSMAQLESNSDIGIRIDEALFGGLVFNKKEGVFSDIKMRQAVAAALDLDAMMYAAYGDEKYYKMTPELMLASQTDWYTNAGTENYNVKDTEKAKQLIAEAGYNGEPIRILTSREYEDYYTYAVVAEAQLKEIGLNIVLEVYDWATVLEKREDPTAYEIFTSGWALRPTPVQYPFLASAGNWAGWTNSPEIDAAIEGVRNATTQEEAFKYTEDLQTAFWNYLPIIKPGNAVDISAYSNKVKGYQYFIGPVLWNVSIEN